MPERKTLQGSLGQWLKNRCAEEHLPLRQAAALSGLSHTTIMDLIKGNHQPLPETIRKLAQAFGGGPNEKVALEDKLRVLAGYRSDRPGGEELSEALAQLIDKVQKFDESRLKMMGHFADFLTEIQGSSS